MPLHIEYNDKTNLSIYAFLFSSADKSKAFNYSSNAFESFSLESQSVFAIPLTEDSSRIGFYSYTISNTSNIPESIDDQWYLVEVFKKTGTNYDRAVDKLAGATAFYWDGTKEVDLSDRNICPTPEEVWEYSSRTLTQELSCPEIPPCPDYSDQIDEIQIKIEQLFQELKNLINQGKISNLPKTQVPKLSGVQPPSTSQNSGIRFS